MTVNALEIPFETMELFEKDGIFTCQRIDKSSVPDGLYIYEIRHSDDDDSIPVSLEKLVVVNHYGTFVTKEPFDLGDKGFLDITEDDYNFTSGLINIEEYNANEISVD